MKSKRVLYPKVVSGGSAVPLGNNFYYMRGRKHKDGGIKIGPNNKTGLEVEGEEVMKLTNDDIKVFSSHKFLGGESPAEKVLQGDNPNKVFNAQENYKDRNGLNDDGTKKFNGGKIMNKKKYAKKLNNGGNIKFPSLTNNLNDSIVKKDIPFSYRNNSLKPSIEIGMGSNKVGVGTLEYINAAKDNISYGDLDFSDYNKLQSDAQRRYRTNDVNINSVMNRINVNKSNNLKLGGKRSKYQDGGIAGALDGTILFGNKRKVVRVPSEEDKKRLSSYEDNSYQIPYFKDRITTINPKSNKTNLANFPTVTNNQTPLTNITNDEIGLTSRGVTSSSPSNRNKVSNNSKPNVVNDASSIIRDTPIETKPIGVRNSNIPTTISMDREGVSTTGEKGTVPFRVGKSIKEFLSNENNVADGIGIASNVIGSIISNRTNNRMLNNVRDNNNKMLDALRYTRQPVARQAQKLKTTININPQLDKMRETVAQYERDVDEGTSSSRVALSRKQRGRIAGMLQTNELYGNKENIETQLINQDRLNQQRTSDANIQDFNRWAEGKSNFDNAVLSKRAELDNMIIQGKADNNVSLVENINAGIQDAINRSQTRKQFDENLISIIAANPNVSPEILRDLGSRLYSDKMINRVKNARSKNKGGK